MNKLKKVLTNQYIYSIITKFLIVLIGFVFTVVQSRYLGIEIKGQVAYITSVTSILSIILGLGIHQAYPYFRKTQNKDLISTFLTIAMIQILVYGAISAIVICIVKSPETKAIAIIVPILVYNKIVSYLSMVDNPNRKNTVEAIVNILDIILICLLWKFVPASFIIGALIVIFKDLAMSITYTINLRNKIGKNTENIAKWIPKLIKFGFFPMLALLMTILNYRLDVIMLKNWVSDSMIGIYSVGISLAERVWMIPDAMKEVMTSRLAKGKDVKEVSYVIRICNTACLCVIFGLILLGQPFINIVFGKEYSGAYHITLILLLGVFFMIYYKMIASYNITIGKQKINTLFLGLSVIANVIANYLLIPHFNIYGAAVSSVISYALCSILFIVYFCKNCDIKITDILFINKQDIAKLKTKFTKKETA